MASLAPLGGMLGKRLAAHLLRRCSYNISRARIESLANMTVTQAVDRLLTPQPLNMSEPIDPATGQAWISGRIPPQSTNSRLRAYVIGWWTHEALLDESIGHKMAFFLHTNFTVSASSQNAERFFDHLSLLRYYHLGNFRILAEKMILDNIMLDYLDNKLNKKQNPNENFAREYFELFTIGKGPQVGPGDYTNYTEEDIAAASRLLTGFQVGSRTQHIDPDTGIPRGRATLSRHDTTDKTFSAAFQNQTITGATTANGMFDELSEFVDMIFDQEATATFICRKLYRFFVSRHLSPEIEQDIITPLATTFRNSDYDLKATMRQLLRSQHFYDKDDSAHTDEIIGGMIKSPIDLVHGALSYFDVDIPDPLTDSVDHYHNFYKRTVNEVIFPQAGFSLFQPSSVAGYPAYYQEPDFHRAWFNPSTIIARYRLPEILTSGRRVISYGSAYVQMDIVQFVQQTQNISNPLLPDILVAEMLEHLLSEIPEADRADYFLNTIFLDGLPAADWTYEWEAFEASGDDSEVRIPLENLVTAIMYSPEYQVF
ncbi:MAG: DUF1800 family protein [Bacteroidota bacterium]